LLLHVLFQDPLTKYFVSDVLVLACFRFWGPSSVEVALHCCAGVA
jgi:hypothetical protein